MGEFEQIVDEFTQSYQLLNRSKDDADLQLFQAKALAKHQLESKAMPCPLCGDGANLSFRYDNYNSRAAVHCNRCTCQVSGEVIHNQKNADVDIQRMASAVMVWNRRAVPPAGGA